MYFVKEFHWNFHKEFWVVVLIWIENVIAVIDRCLGFFLVEKKWEMNLVMQRIWVNWSCRIAINQLPNNLKINFDSPTMLFRKSISILASMHIAYTMERSRKYKVIFGKYSESIFWICKNMLTKAGLYVT